MIEPFSSATKSSAAKVTTGRAAFLKACFQITVRSGSPLMRASLTYSLPSTSSIDERVSRMSPATANQPSVIPGSSTCSGVPRPEVGSSRSITPKTSTSSSPSQNGGTACPSAAKARAA